MKTVILISAVVLLAAAVFAFALKHPAKSYISFENECIEVKAPIEEVADRTIHEFPECAVKSRGRLFSSDFIYGRCGSSALNLSEFLIAADKQDCEAFSSMGPAQKRKAVMEQK